MYSYISTDDVYITNNIYEEESFAHTHTTLCFAKKTGISSKATRTSAKKTRIYAKEISISNPPPDEF